MILNDVSKCRSKERADIIGEVFEKLNSDLQKGTAFQDDVSPDVKSKAPGEAALWTRIFLASHYDRRHQPGAFSLKNLYLPVLSTFSDTMLPLMTPTRFVAVQ